PFDPSSSSGDNLPDLETEAQLVLSDEVADLVADRRGDGAAQDGPDGLDGVSAEVPANTQLIRITVTDDRSADALERAQAFAEVYLAYRRARSESALFDRAAAVKEQVRVQSAELDQRVEALDKAPASSPRVLFLQQQ